MLHTELRDWYATYRTSSLLCYTQNFETGMLHTERRACYATYRTSRLVCYIQNVEPAMLHTERRACYATHRTSSLLCYIQNLSHGFIHYIYEFHIWIGYVEKNFRHETVQVIDKSCISNVKAILLYIATSFPWAWIFHEACYVLISVENE